jgi:hypothetical protein
MSRFIESRENFLWSLGSDNKKNDSVVIYIPGSCRAVFGIECPHLACDVIILSQNDWKIFKKFALNDLIRLEKSGICIKESLVRKMKPTLFQHFTNIRNRNVYSYFASIADNLLQKLRKKYNPIIQKTIRGRPIPQDDHRRLRKLYSDPVSDPVKHFLTYAKLWKTIKDEIAIREKYENNIELYMPEIFILPDELIDYLKSFLF